MIPDWLDPVSFVCGVIFLLFLQVLAVILLYFKYVKSKPDPERERSKVNELIEEYENNA